MQIVAVPWPVSGALHRVEAELPLSDVLHPHLDIAKGPQDKQFCDLNYSSSLAAAP